MSWTPPKRAGLIASIALALLLTSALAAWATRSWGLTGLAVGFLFGFAMQRAAFCGSAIFSSVVLLRDPRGLIGVLLAISVSMLGFAALAGAGWVQVSPKPFKLLPALVGGALFGSGMVLAGGCVSGSLFKAAEGRLNSMLAVVGIAIGANMGVVGLLRPVRLWLGKATAGLSLAPSIDQALGIPYLALAIPVGTVGLGTGWWLWRRFGRRAATAPESSSSLAPAPSTPTPTRPWLARGWSFALAGVVLGVTGWLAYPASAAAGRNYPLGSAESVMMALSGAVGGRLPLGGWMLWLGLGVILGSSFSTWQRGELRLRSADPATLTVAFIGGVMTGLGAVIGMGCFIGHILSGTALLSFQSLLFGVVVLLTNWATTILYLRGLR
ncbi:MAG: YeeE/YedE family protein [bacterium]